MALLLEGNRQEALKWALRLFDRRGARYLYEDIVAPDLHQVGERWASGQIGVADEHIATAIVQTVLAALAPQFPWSKGGPRALVGCVEGERHDIGARMMADLLALDGWDEIFVGSDLPTAQFIEKARELAPRLIAVSVTMESHLPSLVSLVESLRDAVPSAKILVGGLATARLRIPPSLVDAIAPTCSEGVAMACQWKTGSAPRAADKRIATAQMVPRDEWTLIVAHDLRQPLNTIQLATSHLLRLRGDAPSAERATIDRIRSATIRLGGMIDDLSSASLLESGRLKVIQQSVDVGELVTTVVGDLEEGMGDHTVHVVSRDSNVAWIDPDRIHRVLENLLSNAAKYSRPGTDLRIETHSERDFVEVVVTNEGRGIPPDQLGILFEKFTRTREARESNLPGLGLGLYIARRLVEAHDGRIWAESIPGESVSFHFTLPKSAPSSAA